MRRSSLKLAMTTVLLGSVLTMPAAAQAPAKTETKTVTKTETKTETKAAPAKPPSAAEVAKAAKAAGDLAVKAGEKAVKAGEKAIKAADKAEDKAAKADDKAAKAEDKAAKADEKAEGKDHRDDALAAASTKGRGQKNGLRQLVEEIREGKLSKDKVKERMAELEKNRAERQKRHREELREHWGPKLNNPAAIQELNHHARRVAMLNRMLVLLETEHKGKDKDKLVERVEKLTELENARHEKKMAQLSVQASADTPSGSAAASAAAAGSAAPAVQGSAGGAQ